MVLVATELWGTDFVPRQGTAAQSMAGAAQVLSSADKQPCLSLLTHFEHQLRQFSHHQLLLQLLVLHSVGLQLVVLQ